MPENKKLKVAFLWHMHQPFYLNPENNKFMMPWVRLHGLKDYLDMPLMAAQHDVKVTFNLVPSLLDQIEMYCDGCTDRHLDLSRISARDLSFEEEKEILSTFFSAHYPTMIKPYARYRQLYRKKESCGSDIKLAIKTFSASEWRDLQVWSNLTWIDPAFRKEEPLKELFLKGRDFTEEEKEQLLNHQIQLLRRIIPTYQKLFEENKIDISFTPYYHPILPLLIDTDIAMEAIEDISLPRNRFRHPEDARWHIKNAIEKFRSLFGRDLSGTWPSEGSVSEDTLKLITESGLKWMATDDQILYYSLVKSGSDARKIFSPHFSYICEDAPETKIFFRDHGLSDKIGFVYSGWDADRAVYDFIKALKGIREFLGTNLDKCIVPVILDGENAWEYFPDDGTEFLGRLYRDLSEDEQIEVVTLSDAAEVLEPKMLPSLFAGSWINHNFRIWIGREEDNKAWDLLSDARKTLVEYQEKNPNTDPEKLKKAWNQVYVAEGSDWCWWYGDEHRSAYNEEFDRLYRFHLSLVYTTLGLEPPSALLKSILMGKQETFLTYPESLVTPELDGLLTHYYEWGGAGLYDCTKAGGAMHRTDVLIKAIYFAFDHKSFYIRLDFKKDFDLVGKSNCRVIVDFGNIGQKEILLERTGKKDCGDFSFSFKQLLEVEFNRKALIGTGGGKIEFFVTLYLGEESTEKWPIDKPIPVKLPERDKEIFWQV